MGLHIDLTDNERAYLQRNGLRSRNRLSSAIDIATSKLFVGKLNVRKDLGDISELAESIRQVGILEPLVVRPVDKKYEIIAGTRRLAAAKKIGLKSLPCIIRDMDDEQAILVSVTENLQRGDLSEEEVVEAFLLLQRLNPKRWSQQTFAARLGKTQAWLSSWVIAYGALQRLKASGLSLKMKASPSREEREAGSIPVRHLEAVESALRSSEVTKAIPRKNLDKKRVELVKAVQDLPHEDAKRVVDRFRMYPEKSVAEIREQIEARKTGVRIAGTYVPPSVARRLDELAESKDTTMEEVLPEVLEKGLKSEQLTLEGRTAGEKATTEEIERPFKIEVPLSEQYHQQRMWNLQQLNGWNMSGRNVLRFDVITVGFSQKTLEGLFQALTAAGVKALIDVRRNPFSQHRPEFNKDSLKQQCALSSIEYEHIPDLGIPRELRDQAMSGAMTADELFDRYERELMKGDLIDHLAEKARSETIAVLCTEVSPKLCHRHRIAGALRKRGLLCYDI